MEVFKTAPVQFKLSKVSATAADGARRGLAQLQIPSACSHSAPASRSFSHSYGDDWDCFKMLAAASACSSEAKRYFLSGMCQMTAWALLSRIHFATSLGFAPLPPVSAPTPVPPALRSCARACCIPRHGYGFQDPKTQPPCFAVLRWGLVQAVRRVSSEVIVCPSSAMAMGRRPTSEELLGEDLTVDEAKEFLALRGHREDGSNSNKPASGPHCFLLCFVVRGPALHWLECPSGGYRALDLDLTCGDCKGPATLAAKKEEMKEKAREEVLLFLNECEMKTLDGVTRAGGSKGKRKPQRPQPRLAVRGISSTRMGGLFSLPPTRRRTSSSMSGPSRPKRL